MPQGGVTSSAVLNVQISNTAKHSPPSKRFEAVLDSGASQCLFHSDFGKGIGLKIESGEKVETLGVNGDLTEVYLHNVSLYVPGGHILKIRAGFTPKLPLAGLLGMTGFFDHFKITFDPTANEFELQPIYQAQA
jgi:hypothetical protein